MEKFRVAHQDVLVFDLFGVLAKHQDLRAVERMMELVPWHGPALVFHDAYWTTRPLYDRGVISGTEYWTAVVEQLGVSPLERGELHELVRLDVHSWSRPNNQVVQVLIDLSTVNRAVLLSNAPIDVAMHVRQHWSWLTIFERLYFSCEVGLVKPELALYKRVQQEVGGNPANLLLIDDRPENIAGARSAGWRGHLFEGIESLGDGRRTD